MDPLLPLATARASRGGRGSPREDRAPLPQSPAKTKGRGERRDRNRAWPVGLAPPGRLTHLLLTHCVARRNIQVITSREWEQLPLGSPRRSRGRQRGDEGKQSGFPSSL